MRYAGSVAMLIILSFLTACAMFEAKQPAKPQDVPPKVLSVPVGKNWQVIEEPPNLTNERNERPAFQTEQSVQPEGVQRPVPTPTEKQRTIETPPR
ncbi:MAG TPA: hypothetical protein DCZ75_11065 [Geobacter sp.]|nr:hypothetical protein [Geobacter sp.]